MKKCLGGCGALIYHDGAICADCTARMEAMSAKLINNAVDEMSKLRANHIEMFAAAFVKVTDLDPRACELVEQRHADKITWFFRERASSLAPKGDIKADLAAIRERAMKAAAWNMIPSGSAIAAPTAASSPPPAAITPDLDIPIPEICCQSQLLSVQPIAQADEPLLIARPSGA